MQRFLTGKIVTNAAKDTSVVEVDSWKTHRIFRKRYKTTTRFLVQNTDNVAQVGQVVTIMPCRPISKRKSWKIVDEAVVATEPAKKPAAKAKKGSE